MPFILIPLILAALVGFSSGFVTINLPAEVECPEGTVKTQFGNNFECLTKQEPTSSGVLPIPTPSPIPTSKPQVAYKQPEATSIPIVDQDPVIKCNWPKRSKCEGQSVNLRKSECPSGGDYVCCQVDNGWKLMNRSECAKAQNNEARPTNSKPQNIDTINTPVPPTSAYNSGYTPKPLITCIVNYPCTGNSYTYQVDQESCNNFQQSALKICSSSQTNNTNSYVSPVGYGNQPTQDVIYGRDNRLIEENEQRKASGVIPGYEPIKQDVIYGRDDRKY